MESQRTYDRESRPLLALWPIPRVVGIVLPVILEVVPSFLAFVCNLI